MPVATTTATTAATADEAERVRLWKEKLADWDKRFPLTPWVDKDEKTPRPFYGGGYRKRKLVKSKKYKKYKNSKKSKRYKKITRRRQR